MQEITFAKGNEQHLKDCRDALCQSTLGERYFSSPGSAENAILEGIRQENLYVAFIGEEFGRFIDELKKLPEAVSEFDEALWGSLVEYVTVGKDKTMVFTMLGGTEIGIQ